MLGGVVASHQRHHAGLSPLRDPGESPDHDLEVACGRRAGVGLCGHSGSAAGSGGNGDPQ